VPKGRAGASRPVGRGPSSRARPGRILLDGEARRGYIARPSQPRDSVARIPGVDEAPVKG
jgi:hypothetical protein